MVGNKNDLYEHEEVSNEEGIELSKQLNSIYQRTSAKDEYGGIDDLFKNIGRKLINPNAEISTIMSKEERKKKGEELMRDKIKKEKKKNKCC